MYIRRFYRTHVRTYHDVHEGMPGLKPLQQEEAFRSGCNQVSLVCEWISCWGMGRMVRSNLCNNHSVPQHHVTITYLYIDYSTHKTSVLQKFAHIIMDTYFLQSYQIQERYYSSLHVITLEFGHFTTLPCQELFYTCTYMYIIYTSYRQNQKI